MSESTPVTEPADERSVHRTGPRWSDVLGGMFLLVVAVSVWRTAGGYFTILLKLGMGLLTLLFPLWVLKRRGEPIRWSYPGWRRLLAEIALGGLVAVGSFFVFSYLHQLVSDRSLLNDPTYRWLIQARSIVVPTLFMLLGATLFPLAEEVFFRRFLYRFLRKRLGFVLGMVLQAGFFAVLHLQGLPEAAFIFLSGVLLAGVYEWRNTLVTPVFAHALHNCMDFAMVFAAMLSFGARPHLGVALGDAEEGCRILFVTDHHTASRIGLRPGDVVMRIEGKGIENPQELSNALLRHEVGEAIRVTYRRDGERREGSAKLTAYRPNVLW